MQYPEATLKELGMMLKPAGGQIGSQSQTEKAECNWLTNCGRNKEENYYDQKTNHH